MIFLSKTAILRAMANLLIKLSSWYVFCGTETWFFWK